MSRPLKKAEYEIVFITRDAEKGWQDLLATQRNAVVDAWDQLTVGPTAEDGTRLYRLRADLATGRYEGQGFDRYQYKCADGARIWYFVVPPAGKERGRVLLEQVHTRHPKQTWKSKN